MPFPLLVFLMPLPDAGEGYNRCSNGRPPPALAPNTDIMRTPRAPSNPTSSSHTVGDVAALRSHLPSLRCGVLCLSVLLLPPNSPSPRASAAVCLRYSSHSTVLSLHPSPEHQRCSIKAISAARLPFPSVLVLAGTGLIFFITASGEGGGYVLTSTLPILSPIPPGGSEHVAMCGLVASWG